MATLLGGVWHPRLAGNTVCGELRRQLALGGVLLPLAACKAHYVSYVRIAHSNPRRTRSPRLPPSPLGATRGGVSIRAEVIRLIEQELAMVDDIEAALGAVLGPAPRRRCRPPAT